MPLAFAATSSMPWRHSRERLRDGQAIDDRPLRGGDVCRVVHALDADARRLERGRVG
jgi:hypothetical protein